MNDIISNNLPDDFLLKDVPYVNIINQSKVIFDHIFSSKHVSTTEVINSFEEIILKDKEHLNDITVYNIAYYLSFKNNTSKYFEDISDYLISRNLVWSRILYVDISFLKLKKKIDDKQYVRIRRKMDKHKFLIQHLLKSTIEESNSENGLKSE